MVIMSTPLLVFLQVTWNGKPCACHSFLLLSVRSCFLIPTSFPWSPPSLISTFSVDAFFLAHTFTGKTYYNRIHSWFVCFNKSGYGPLVHSHIAPTQVCLFLLPSKQSSGKSSIYGFGFGWRGRTYNTILYKVFISSLEGIENKQRLQTLSIDNAWSKKISCFTWRFVCYNIHLQKWTVITVTNI